MTVLELSNVAKKFGPTTALDGVTLAVERGEVHALIGENGAGKSTLLNIIAGTIAADRGEMKIGGSRYVPLTSADAQRAGVRLIHQELSLFPHLSVEENIFAGVEPAASLGWLDRRVLRSRAIEVLAGFGHPEINPGRRVGELPIAARQVVEICRAVAARASIILMDEPTSSLERADIERLFRLIKRLKQEGVSIIYVSHFLEEVREAADSFTVLRDGSSVSSGKLSSISDEQLIAQMVGRAIKQLFPDRKSVLSSSSEPSAGGEVALEVRNLSAPPVVVDAGFTLHRGEILGIAGLMGAGRTEMVRAVFGLIPSRSGTVSVLGSKAKLALNEGTPAQRLQQGVGYLSEDRKGEGLVQKLSVADNITLSCFSTCANRFGWLDLAGQKRQSEKWINRLRIKSGSPAQTVSSLSGGNQQKVAISRLLHQESDVLLFDEPTRGIDIGSKAEVYEIMAECAASGKAVLMISSYLPELFGMCDRLAVMSRGKLSPARPIGEWSPETVIQAAIGDTSTESSRKEDS